MQKSNEFVKGKGSCVVSLLPHSEHFKLTCQVTNILHIFSQYHIIGSSRGSETILGETSDSKELFLVDECDDNPLGSIVQKCVVSLSEYILWSYLVLFNTFCA